MLDSLHNRCRRDPHPGAAASSFRAAARLGLLLLLAMATPLAGQNEVSLFGRVVDEDGRPVSAVAVTLAGGSAPAVRRTVLTDAGGNYRFVGLRPGRYTLRTDHLGYAVAERPLDLVEGGHRLDLQLRTALVELEEVLVRGRGQGERERVRFETEPGVTARVVEGSALKLLPGLAEADVLRAVELLPGVVSTSDFSSAYHVRGGSADQNLFLLDGFPIFNPFHLGGVFGVFNGDAIARAELLAGGFGAEYGGRVASVLNVESRAEPRFEVQGGVSLLASRLLVRAPLPEGAMRRLGAREGSWFLSARRSYFDQLLRPVLEFPYHLTDLQGHATLVTARGGRLSLTGYAGEDVLDLSEFGAGSSDASSILRLRWNWGNQVAGVRWEQPLGSGWALDGRLGYSAFAESLGFTDFGDTRFSGAIDQILLRADLTRHVGARVTLLTGLALDRISYENRAEAGGTVFFDAADRGVLGGSYAAVRWRPDTRWIVEPGLRLDAWNAADTAHVLLSPRFAAKRFLGAGQAAAVKLSVGRYTQFLHSLRNEEFPVSNDTWVVADRHVPPVISDQLQVGFERHWEEGWSASLEAYVRHFRGVTEVNLADDPNDPGDDLLAGTGRSRGIDLLLRRSTGGLTGWIALSFLSATRTLPDPLAEGWEDLPPEVTFPPGFDRRIDLDLVAQYDLPLAVELGLRWNYGSPLPYTRPVGQYLGWRFDAMRGRFEPSQTFGSGVPLYVLLGSRNQQRYPAYHRLDVTLRRTFRPAWGSWTPYLQVLNVYNRRNVLFYFYNYDRLPPTRSGLSMFPLLPTVGVDFSFR